MIQICTDWFNLKQKYAKIIEDTKTEKNDWDLSHDVDESDGPTYISDEKSETELALIQNESETLNSVSTISHQQQPPQSLNSREWCKSP